MAPLDALDELIAELAHLQESVVRQLRDRRERLCEELASVNAELEELEEKPAPAKKKPAKVTANAARKPTLPELTAELEAAPEHTLNIRKAHLDVKHIKALAKANPQALQLGGKGGWPTVTLLKAAPQGMFAFGETSVDLPDSSAAHARE